MFSLKRIRIGRKIGNTNHLVNRRREPTRMKSLFRKKNNTEWETWTDFHKKYQSDVYRHSAKGYTSSSSGSGKNNTNKGPMKNESGFFGKLMDSSVHQPKTAQRRSSLGGPQPRRRRRASLG